MKRRVLRTLAAVVALAGVAGATVATTIAATASANLTVSATVTTNCTISTSALAFGDYDPVVANAATNLDGSGSVTVACTKGASPTIALGAGSNGSGSTRRMSNGSGGFLTYELYQDSSRATVWSASGAGLLSTTAATSKTAREFTVYGRIAGNQDVAAGSYSDTVVATVNF